MERLSWREKLKRTTPANRWVYVFAIAVFIGIESVCAWQVHQGNVFTQQVQQMSDAVNRKDWNQAIYFARLQQRHFGENKMMMEPIIARFYVEARDHRGAAAEYEKFINTNLAWENDCLNYGNALHALGRTREARAQWQRVLDMAASGAFANADDARQAQANLRKYH